VGQRWTWKPTLITTLRCLRYGKLVIVCTQTIRTITLLEESFPFRLMQSQVCSWATWQGIVCIYHFSFSFSFFFGMGGAYYKSCTQFYNLSTPGAESHCWHRTPKPGKEGVRESEAWSHFTRRHGEAKCLHDINNNRHKLLHKNSIHHSVNLPTLGNFCAHFMCKCLECFASEIRKGIRFKNQSPSGTRAHTHTH
jgi:hypothetical protein